MDEHEGYLEMVITSDELSEFSRAIQRGYAERTTIVLYRGVGMDHRVAHRALEALASGESEVTLLYEPWQRLGPDLKDRQSE